MYVQPLFSMYDEASSAYIETWFMNKVSASGVLKIPTSTLLGSKQRSMQTILGLSLVNCGSQKQVRQCATTNDVGNRLNGFGCASSAKIDTGSPSKSLSQQLAVDDNKEMEKLTLRDMKRMLRKATEKPLNKVGSAEPVSGNHSCSSSDSGTLPSVDSEAPSVGLELLLEDSTSNSSESMSLKRDLAGNSSSSDISRGFSADLLCGHKRLSMASESSEDTEVIEDDEWTLQKWQKLYHKKSTLRKRLRKACKVQAEVYESIGEVCSSSPSLALRDVSAGVSEVASSQDASSLSEKVLKENCEVDSSHCKPHKRPVAIKDPLPTTGSLAPEQSCQLLPSMVRLELEQESEIVSSKVSMPGRLQNISKSGWALKACSKIETNPFSKSALQHAMLEGKTSSDMSFRKAGELLNISPERACLKVSGQRKQSEEITWSLSPGNKSGSEEQRTATSMHNTGGTFKPRSVLSQELRCFNVNHAHTTLKIMSSNVPTEQLEGTLSLEHSKGTDCLEQSGSIISQLNSKAMPNYSASLNCMETFEIEEEHEPHQKPAKIPCRRKAISPMSQEFLLKASKLGEFGVSAEKRGMKKPPLVSDAGWVDVPKWNVGADDRNAQNLEAPQSDASLVASPEKCIMGLNSAASQHTLAHTHKMTLSFPRSPSNTQDVRKGMAIILPSGSSPPMPAKGILRSGCQGLCGCEECASVRSRADRASEFSQRQMQDIEGLAVKLMKDLSILRNIVEDRLLQGSVKHLSPRPALSVDQLKKVTANALETEEKAKKWLVRMARDCNRYCKIMRMQGRKLTFADESGGKLCHVKVFRSEPAVSDSSIGLHGKTLEVDGTSSSVLSEPAVEVACLVKDATTDKV